MIIWIFPESLRSPSPSPFSLLKVPCERRTTATSLAWMSGLQGWVAEKPVNLPDRRTAPVGKCIAPPIRVFLSSLEVWHLERFRLVPKSVSFHCLTFPFVLRMLKNTFTTFPVYSQVFRYLEHTNICFVFPPWGLNYLNRIKLTFTRGFSRIAGSTSNELDTSSRCHTGFGTPPPPPAFLTYC